MPRCRHPRENGGVQVSEIVMSVPFWMVLLLLVLVAGCVSWALAASEAGNSQERDVFGTAALACIVVLLLLSFGSCAHARYVATSNEIRP